MGKKEQLAASDRGRRVRESFPKRLTGDAIRRLKAALETATEGEPKLEAACAWEKFEEHLSRAVGDYAESYLTPRLFSALRRNKGDPAASPADYDCRCPVRDDDGIPICLARRPDCKFQGMRRSHNKMSNDWTGLDDVWFHTRRSLRNGLLDRLSAATPDEMACALDECAARVRRVNARRKRTTAQTNNRADE